MARGSDAKERRKEERKEARKAEKERLLDEVNNEFDPNSEFPTPETQVDNDGADAGEQEEKPVMKKKKRKKTKVQQQAPDAPPPTASKTGIKSGPLILLVMLTGTTLLPALLYAGDWLGGFIQKNHIMGNLGHRLNIGSSPKKRVLSFYEKHDPNKIDEVDGILAKYYGDYPKLVKRLERKYGDYGYFINWEKDEAPMTLAFEQIDDTKKYIQKQFNIYAPQGVKNTARNVNYNVSKLYRKGKIVWRKKVWPILEPIFGVPDGGAAQKRKDRNDASKKKGRRKANADFEDDF